MKNIENKRFFVYDIREIKVLKEKLKGYEFWPLTSIKRICDNTETLYSLDIDKHAIDITNFFIDTSNGRWHKGVIEEYIEILMEISSEVILIIEVREFKKFQDMYPFLIDEDNIEYIIKKDEEKEKDNTNVTVHILSRLQKDIHVYDDRSFINEYDGEYIILSFSHLSKGYNGLNVSFQFEKLLDNSQYYIDLSTLVKYLELRPDQIFLFELILLELAERKNIEFIILKKASEQLHQIFPFVFYDEKHLNQRQMTNVLEDENSKIDTLYLSSIEYIYRQVDMGLKGHEDFKKDFKKNLFKFEILNKIGRRKIMSIFLCGKSGVGKTEFARLLSKTMYPTASQIKLNFGNYSTEGVLNSLIGSPLGYVGSEKGGELINKIQGSESKIILIDEFEKADEKVFNFFYELLEDGQFTDRAGNIHDLNGYIIIFTSNLNEVNYKKVIPEPLESRFDMRYIFSPLDNLEKWAFIEDYSENLIQDILNNRNATYDKEKVDSCLKELSGLNNLRDIKRKIEDVVVSELKFKEQIKNTEILDNQIKEPHLRY